jgi:hypothetical protein
VSRKPSTVGRKISLYVDSAGESILAARDGAVSRIKRYGRRSLPFEVGFNASRGVEGD